MSRSLADRQPRTQLPEDLELPLFDPQLPASSYVAVTLDRQVPLCRLEIDSYIDDNNCACG
jgi:hypothetical protein